MKFRRIIASFLMLAIAAMPAVAATPNQYNPNTVVPVGVDNSTLNAATPFVDHTSGGMYVTVVASSGVTSVANTGSSAPAAATQIGGVNASGNLAAPTISTYGSDTALVVDNVANGTAGASAPNQVNVIAGLDASGNVRTVLTSPSGVQYIIMESVKASYRASASDVSPAASATDITTLCGSATKTIRVNHVGITADASAAGVLDFYIFKTSVADTGGAISSVSAGQMDSNDPAPSATVVKYTVNPTLGARVLVASDHYALPAAASTGIPVFMWAEDFGTRNNETMVLRGTAQCLAVNLNGQTIPTGTNIYVNYGWTEE